jgi:ADP-ribose pyrophosphatase YjhB (NUDIX family)
MATAALTDARWLTYRRGGGVTTESSSVVVLNERNEVLLGLRADARMWALPAGRCEAGETYEKTAVREVREETGYEIELERLVGAYWRPQMPHGGDRMQVYVGRVVGGDPSAHDRENLEVRWFPLDALPRWLFAFSREHIEDALTHAEAPLEREQRFSGIEAALLWGFLAMRRLVHLLRRRRA